MISALRCGCGCNCGRGRGRGLERASAWFLLDAFLEDGQRLASQEQVTLLEDVVRVELGDRRHLDPLDVPRAAVERGVQGGQSDQDRAVFERALAGPGL